MTDYREREGGAAISNREVRKGLTENVTLEQILERADDCEPCWHLEGVP